MRERNGNTLPFVFKSEDEAIPTIQARVMPGSTVYADEAPCWDALHARFAAKRVNHSVAFKDEDACTNQAESYFSRLARLFASPSPVSPPFSKPCQERPQHAA